MIGDIGVSKDKAKEALHIYDLGYKDGTLKVVRTEIRTNEGILAMMDIAEEDISAREVLNIKLEALRSLEKKIESTVQEPGPLD